VRGRDHGLGYAFRYSLFSVLLGQFFAAAGKGSFTGDSIPFCPRQQAGFFRLQPDLYVMTGTSRHRAGIWHLPILSIDGAIFRYCKIVGEPSDCLVKSPLRAGIMEIGKLVIARNAVQSIKHEATNLPVYYFDMETGFGGWSTKLRFWDLMLLRNRKNSEESCLPPPDLFHECNSHLGPF